MRYLYRRGHGARRRVMHLTGFDPVTGKPTMTALCGAQYPFDTTSNVPWGQRTCKRCAAEAGRAAATGRSWLAASSKNMA